MRSPREPRLTDRDLRLLSFLAEHTQVIDRQLAALVGSSPDLIRKRLSRLTDAGYVARDRAFAEVSFWILPRGLRAIGADLKAPEPKSATFRHDVGVAGLWLAARDGAFGPVAAVIGERRMRSHDEAAISADELYAVRLGGVTDRGQERRHYPDALLIDPHGRRLALELELSHKGVSRLAEIVAGYAADRRLDGVIYLVENSSAGRQIGRAIKASTIQMDASERIHVRRVMPIGHLSRPRHGPARRPTRSRAPAGLDAGR